MSRHTLHITFALLLLILSAACTSRYRLDLLMAVEKEAPGKVKVVSARCLPHTRLGSPATDRKLLPGDRTALVIRTSARGETLPFSPLAKALQFDENIQTELYLEIDEPPAAGNWTLEGRSFVQVLGRFDRPAEEKLFLPEPQGWVAVDSVTTKHLYVSLLGEYRNHVGQLLTFDGKVRIDRPQS